MAKKTKRYFPMFVDLSDQKVVVAGAGTIAKRRIRALCEFSDNVVVIAPEVNKELKDMEATGKIKILRKYYEKEDIYDAALVIAATNNNRTNQEIYTHCKCLGIPVNVYTDKEKCDFYFPSLAVKGNLVVAMSTTDKDHKELRSTMDEVKTILKREEQE